jgi:hypothetical protein
MWRMGGIGPMPNPSSPFLTVKNEADRRYGIELTCRNPLSLRRARPKARPTDLAIWCLEPGAASLKRKG